MEQEERIIHRGRITGWRECEPYKPQHPPGQRRRIRSYGRIIQEAKD
jgi:hypothetical protein